MLQGFFQGFRDLRTVLLRGNMSEGSRAAWTMAGSRSLSEGTPWSPELPTQKMWLQWLVWGRGSSRGPHVLCEGRGHCHYCWGSKACFIPTGLLNRLPLMPNCFSHLSVLSDPSSSFWFVTQTCSLHLQRQDGSVENNTAFLWIFSVTANF